MFQGAVKGREKCRFENNFFFLIFLKLWKKENGKEGNN